jgi:hypothetical protein
MGSLVLLGSHHVNSAVFGVYSVLRGSPNPSGFLNLVNLTVNISRNCLLSNEILKIRDSVICYWHYSQSAFIHLGCVVNIGRELLASGSRASRLRSSFALQFDSYYFRPSAS